MTVTCQNITVTTSSDCVSGYMVNGIISRASALQAVTDYMNGAITKECACEVVATYATQSGDQTVSIPGCNITACMLNYMVNGLVSKANALKAVNDYMDGLITKACACDVVALYGSQSGDPSVVIPGCTT